MISQNSGVGALTQQSVNVQATMGMGNEAQLRSLADESTPAVVLVNERGYNQDVTVNSLKLTKTMELQLGVAGAIAASLRR